MPVRHGGWWYYGRTVEGLQYGIAGRIDLATFPERPVLDTDGPPQGEQVVLDENVEAQGHEFFALGASDVSPDGNRLAYAVDVTGDERYDLHVRDLRTGAELDDVVTDIGAGVAWSLDGQYVFYTRYDDAWRPFQVWRHEVGAPVDQDVLVHEEKDEIFRVGVGSSRDDRWVVIGVGSSTSIGVPPRRRGAPDRRPDPRGREGAEGRVRHRAARRRALRPAQPQPGQLRAVAGCGP